MINLPAVASAIAAIASLALGFLVYARVPDRAIGNVFGFLAVALACWNANFVVLYAVHDYQSAFWLAWVARTGAVFVTPAILHLALVLPGTPLSRGWRAFLLGDYAYSVCLAALNLAGLLVQELAHFEWGYYSIGTAYYNLFAVSVAVNAILSIGVLGHVYITTESPRMRLQLKFWLLGMVIALPMGITNILPSYGVPFYPLGNLGSVVWAAIVGYAIIRYRLMDIEIVVARLLSFVLTTMLIVVPVFLVSMVMQGVAFGEVHYDFSAALAALLTLVGVVFSSLRIGAERRLERVLFPARVESRSRLSALGAEVVRVLDRERLLDLVTESIVGAFGLDRIAIYLRSGTRHEFDLVRWLGPVPTEKRFQGDSPLPRWLRRAGEAMIREEAPRSELGVDGGGVGAVLGANGWEVCVPFLGGHELLGFVALGGRSALQAYGASDLRLLSRVAADASIALHNSKLYDEVRHSREVISRAGRLSAIGTLAAGIAHEIRNPLVSIQTFFQLAPGRLDDEEFMTSFLGLAENEVQRIGRLVTELLTFAKSPAAAVREVDAEEIVARALALLEPQARSGRVSIETVVSGSIPIVLGDADRLMQVFLNLILNALQASPVNGIVRIVAGEEVRDGEGYCVVAVEDQGDGIPIELREAIFDPFFTTKDKGTGLGLAICHQIVVEAGGFMVVESAPQRGSTFKVYLPTLRTPAAWGEA